MERKNIVIGILVLLGFIASSVLAFFYGLGLSNPINSSSGLSASDYVVALVAVYGAILSTYGIYQSYEDKQAKIKVELNYGITKDGLGTTETYLISAKNLGERTVTLSNVAFNLPKGYKIEIMTPLRERRLPCKLQSGECFTVDYDMRTLVQTLEKQGCNDLQEITAYYSDQIGNKYQSNPVTIMRFSE